MLFIIFNTGNGSNDEIIILLLIAVRTIIGGACVLRQEQLTGLLQQT